MKYTDVEDVDVKDNGERIALPSSYAIYRDVDVDGDEDKDRDIYGDGFGNKNDSWDGRNHSCASTRFQRITLKNKTPFPMG